MNVTSTRAFTPAEGVFNFGGILGAPGAKAKYSVLPVPYDLTASYLSGMRNGPRAIIDASTHMELYDDELQCEPYTDGIETLQQVEPTALGPEEMIKRVRASVEDVLEAGKTPVVLGGEHSITLGAVEALLDRYPRMSVLQLDAHADMRDSYMDSPYNHACVARRISELCPIVQVGIRSLSVEEAGFLKSTWKTQRGRGARITTHYAPDVIKAIAAGKARSLLKNLTEDVFITVDLDVFDPSVMPSTGTPEPGGLLWYDVLAVLRDAATGRNVVGFDVVELCPMPGNVAPDFMAAKLVYKMMGYASALAGGKRPGRSAGIRQ